MRRALRLIARVFAVLLFLILLPVCVIGGVLWLTLPPSSGQVRMAGLSAPVEVAFDTDGVPRIHAATMQDAAEALGYVHARDRMFQMDLMRRAASGRLSEIAGPMTLRLDRMARIMGLRHRAEADLNALTPDTRAMLDAYARGVNAWIEAHGRFAAPEFAVFGAPDPWAPVDSLLWGKTMGLWLSSNYTTELARRRLTGKLPQDRIDQLWPADEPGGHPDAALTGTRFASLMRRTLAALPRFPDAFTQPGEESDEWAVDGRHSATGAPLLAGDPHLALGFPSIWYLARIDTPQGTLAGATAPGVPFLILGHNGHLAWTFTTAGADTQDVFEETVLPDGTYQTPDGPKPFATRPEVIKIRGRPDETLTVRETRHGPVISDADPGNAEGKTVLALEAMNLAPDDTAASGLLALNRAATIEQAGRAAAAISAPVQNLLVADRSRIALFTTGKVPIRKAGDGAMPVPGADGAHDWTGSAGGLDLPYFVAPASGRLVNANERTAPPDFPVFMGRDQFGDWRARRIRQLLDSGGKLTAADMARMQADTVGLLAKQLLPILAAVPASDGTASRAQALLRNWDGQMAEDLPQPLIFNAWVQRFYLDVLARAGIAGLWSGPWQEFVQWVLTPAGAGWCAENCRPMLARALDETVAALSARFGDDPAAWRWGDVHEAVFAHPLLGRLPVVGRLATARIAVPGDGETLFRGAAPAGELDSVHGPEYRGVYDLSDLDRSLFMMAPGQSGHLLSPHAWDFLRRWHDGATVMLGPRPDKTQAQLKLVP